ncbi:MAG: M28 family peptidase [Acinetobacter sp.]
MIQWLHRYALQKNVQRLVFGLVAFSLSPLLHANNANNAEPQNLTVYMEQLLAGGDYRTFKEVKELNRVSAWIREQMRLFGVPCQYQTYKVNDEAYRNVVCTLKGKSADKVIVGAHYDVFEEKPGADDNASGVAGVIETARILAAEKSQLKNTVEFVFYTLNEAPFSGTEDMGSYIHAKAAAKQPEQIQSIYILENIGYYDSSFVQEYPIGLKWIYPSHGNFIAAVGNLQSRAMTGDFCGAMKNLNQLQCERLIAPSFVQAMDFSDHNNYWAFDLPAIVITDTGIYRNKNIHTDQDIIDKLDVEKMGQVVNGLVQAILK